MMTTAMMTMAAAQEDHQQVAGTDSGYWPASFDAGLERGWLRGCLHYLSVLVCLRPAVSNVYVSSMACALVTAQSAVRLLMQLLGLLMLYLWNTSPRDWTRHVRMLIADSRLLMQVYLTNALLAMLSRWRVHATRKLQGLDARLTLVGQELLQLEAAVNGGNSPEELGEAYVMVTRRTTSLSFPFDGLVQLPTSVRHLRRLSKIDLSGHNLVQFPSFVGTELPLLRFLFLERNAFDPLTMDFSHGFEALEILDIRECGIPWLPDSIGRLASLSELCMSTNAVSTFPDSMRQLTNLTKINAIENQLAELPDWIGEWTRMRKLSIAENQLQGVPDSVSMMRDLESLTISHNQLDTYPAAFHSFQHLTRLSLAENNITMLPATVATLPSLVHLKVCGNRLSSLPAELGHLQSLKQLNVARNYLTSMPRLAYMNADSVHLRHNSFHAGPRAGRVFPGVQSLVALAANVVLEHEIEPIDVPGDVIDILRDTRDCDCCGRPYTGRAVHDVDVHELYDDTDSEEDSDSDDDELDTPAWSPFLPLVCNYRPACARIEELDLNDDSLSDSSAASSPLSLVLHDDELAARNDHLLSDAKDPAAPLPMTSVLSPTASAAVSGSLSPTSIAAVGA